MKFLDEVRVINDVYKDKGITCGMRGTVIEADIRWNSFYICFPDQRTYDKNFMQKEENVFKLDRDICLGVKIGNMEIVSESKIGDKEIYENLPENHKDCWCKVDKGYILNLKGEKKNKIPYDYES